MMPNLNLWLIPVLPLIGAALNGLFGKRLTRQAVVTVALAFSGASFGLALFVAARFSTLELPHVETVAQWIRAGNFRSDFARSEEHTSELQSHSDLVCRLLLEKKKNG